MWTVYMWTAVNRYLPGSFTSVPICARLCPTKKKTPHFYMQLHQILSDFWATVCKNGSPYAIGPLSVYMSVCDVGVL